MLLAPQEPGCTQGFETWGSWLACSGPCGTQTRNKPSLGFGKGSIETRQCKTHNCPGKYF